MHSKVDQILNELVLRFRRTADRRHGNTANRVVGSCQNGSADASGGRMRPLPVAVGRCTDVRQAVRKAPPASYAEVYPVEPTTWGLAVDGSYSGFNPPPCAPPAPLRPQIPACQWKPLHPSVPSAPGVPTPPAPRIVPCRPPQPFRLFDGSDS